jgi:hypothetical protein
MYSTLIWQVLLGVTLYTHYAMSRNQKTFDPVSCYKFTSLWKNHFNLCVISVRLLFKSTYPIHSRFIVRTPCHKDVNMPLKHFLASLWTKLAMQNSWALHKSLYDGTCVCVSCHLPGLWGEDRNYRSHNVLFCQKIKDSGRWVKSILAVGLMTVRLLSSLPLHLLLIGFFQI